MLERRTSVSECGSSSSSSNQIDSKINEIQACLFALRVLAWLTVTMVIPVQGKCMVLTRDVHTESAASISSSL
jgi:hypothetical protein